MNTRLEVIGPEQAKIYLQMNTGNRNLQKGVVEQYAKDIRAGNWTLTHQGIAFAKDGRLLDGQHRLEAIVLAGIAVEMLVTFGLDDIAQAKMDTLSIRKPSHSVSILRGENITQETIAAIKAATELTNGSGGHNRRLTNTQLSDAVGLFDPALQFLDDNFACRDRGVKSAVVRGQLALAWFYVEDLCRFADFCFILSGKKIIDNPGDKAAHLLREFLLRSSRTRNSTVRFDTTKKVQSAIVAFMSRKPISKLIGIEPVYRFPLVDPVRKAAFDLPSSFELVKV
jgi:hypothetical protein